MKRISLFAAVAALAMFVSAFVIHAQAERTRSKKPEKQDAKAIAAIRAVLDAQAAAWNRGDIEGYMDGYARTDDIVFISGDSVTYGWTVVLERYKRNYNTREKMGTLSFSELEIKLIGKDAATVIGRWKLVRASDAPHGRFTLIFRKLSQGWRIIHDHTSSAS